MSAQVQPVRVGKQSAVRSAPSWERSSLREVARFRCRQRHVTTAREFLTRSCDQCARLDRAVLALIEQLKVAVPSD